MNISCRNIFLASSCLILASCDPDFRSASSECSVASGASTAIALEGDPDTPLEELFRVPAQTTSDTYQLFLESLLEALQPAEGVTLTAIEQETLDTFINFVNSEDFFNLGYEIVDGEVISAANTLDFLESIISSTDPDTQNGLFQQNRELIASAIESDDDVCNVSNLGAQFVLDGSTAEDVSSQTQFVYSPFLERVDQIIAISQVVDAPTTGSDFFTIPFISSTFSEPEDYVTEGFAPPFLRSVAVNTTDRNTNLQTIDDFNARFSTLEVSTMNTFCTIEDGTTNFAGIEVPNVVNVVCPEGTVTRVPQKPQCDGSDPDGIDETGMVELRSLALNSQMDGFRRVRIETNFETNTVRVFGSTYLSAILDSDFTTIIEDPTNCEVQAVLNERIEQTPEETIVIDPVPDPGFDIFQITDDDGNPVLDEFGEEVFNDPTPIFEYTGTLIPGR